MRARRSQAVSASTSSVAPGEIRAVAIGKNGKGAVASREFGLPKKDWTILETSSETEGHAAQMAIDANDQTYWQSNNDPAPDYVVIDLGKEYSLKGFAYTPQKQQADGMIAKGSIKVSSDGSSWRDAGDFEFGNLVNDPSTRTHYFNDSVDARFVRIESTEIAAPGNSAAIAEFDLFIE